MGGFDKVGHFIKEHPYTTAGIVIVVGGAAILFLSNSGSSSNANSGSGDVATSAYFTAEANQAEAGDQLQETQILAQASTAQAGINANAQQNINSTWAGADVIQSQTQANAEVQVAPYQAATTLGGDISQLALAPPLTTTTTSTDQSKNNGLFGLFGSTKNTTSTTTSQTANPDVVSGENQLESLIGQFFTPPVATSSSIPPGTGGMLASH